MQSCLSLVIHGGAGNIVRELMTEEKAAAYRADLKAALEKGKSLLLEGASAIEATEAAVQILEDSILFNAGRGAVYANSGEQEMDAALMCGKTLEAGSICGVQQVRYPISLARKVLEHSEHVLLSGTGALAFAKEQGLSIEDKAFFHSEYRYQQFLKARELGEVRIEHHPFPDGDEKFGTVGAVACDAQGNIAAATSTGGMTNKKYGRIGDSPITGVGNYANNRTCAVSCTGHGEYFMRAVAAYDLSCLMEYKGMTLKAASEHLIYEKIPALGGMGGLIAVDAKGAMAMPFNTAGMYRSYWSSIDDQMGVKIFRE